MTIELTARPVLASLDFFKNTTKAPSRFTALMNILKVEIKQSSVPKSKYWDSSSLGIEFRWTTRKIVSCSTQVSYIVRNQQLDTGGANSLHKLINQRTQITWKNDFTSEMNFCILECKNIFKNCPQSTTRRSKKKLILSKKEWMKIVTNYRGY